MISLRWVVVAILVVGEDHKNSGNSGEANTTDIDALNHDPEAKVKT